MRFVHCSDVHITEDYLRLPWRKLGWRRWVALGELSLGGRAAAFRAAPGHLARIAHASKTLADHLIVSGDLTAYALEGEFRGARTALAEVVEDPQRCSVIPGNHDVFTPNSHHSRRFERHFGHLLVSDFPEYCREGAFPFVRRVGTEAAVIGLRSARVPFFPGLSYGRIGPDQLASLAALIKDPRLKGRALLVVVHHAPLNRHGVPDKLWHGLRDAEALMQLLPGPRFAVLHGHIHHRYHHPATAERPHLFGAGSSTQAGLEGYWLIEVKNGKVLGGEQKILL